MENGGYPYQDNKEERMKILKRIMIVFGVIVILTIVVVLVLLQSLKMNGIEEDQTIPLQSDIQKVDNYAEYSTVMYCIRDNLYKKKDYKIITIKEMYDQEETLTLVNYYVKTTTRDIMNEQKEEDYYVNVTLDYEMYNYSIRELTKEEYIEFIEGKKEDIIKEVNTLNKFKPLEPTDEEKCQMLLDDIIDKLINDTQQAYNLLTDKCKQESFPTYQDLKKYVEEKEDFENSINAKKYKIEKEVGNTTYIVIDEYNNQYIFYETTPLNYTVEITK